MSISRLVLSSIGLLLIGYAVFNKGFAYLGIAPIYIGEFVMAVSLFAVLAGGFSARAFGSPTVWAVLIFIIWGAARTIPYLGEFGVNALRDSVIWSYSVFALLVAGALLRSRSVGLIPGWYATWFPWFLVIAPIAFLVYEKFEPLIPQYPGTNIPIIWMKAGDMGVHLAGVAAFLALGLHRHFPKPSFKGAPVKEFCLWILLGFDVVVAGSRNRGGLLSVLVVCAVIMIFKPMNRLNRFILPALLMVMVAITIDLNIPIGGGRHVAVQQIFQNVESIFFESDKRTLAHTTSWRLEWWRQIRDDTIYGDYLWSGRGYGINLTEGTQFDDGTANRSPHNGHLTILARSGVPGLIIWLVLLGVVAYSLIQAYFRARAVGNETLASLNLWVFAYWTAFLVNASFDVYLEGPQGGIWFWCIIGFAIALTEEQHVSIGRSAGKTVDPGRVSQSH